MTDKEMLQEALEWQEHIKVLANDHAEDELYQKRSKVFDWLIKQAEKVEQLQQESEKLFEQKENMWKTIDYQQKQLQQAQAKAERYKHALKFYAGGNHYSDKLYDDKIILLDDGEIARKALEGKMI